MEQGMTVPVRPERRAAAARCKMYGLFSRLFSYPSGERAGPILDGSLFREMRDAAAGLPYASTLAAQPWPAVPTRADELEAGYCALFDATRPKGGAASLNEKDHVEIERSQLWEELLRFYDHFGLDFSTERVGEFPDHLVAELDFVHYLAFLEAGTEADGDDFARARQDFLARHLAAWVPSLADKLSKADPASPYTAFSGLLRAFLAEEEKAAA